MSEAAEELYGDRFPLATTYVDLLASTGVEWGLIGPREVGRIWERHILNSAALSSLVSAGTDVVDVGSGAGLPGIALAVLRPDLRVTLLEPLLRRSTFLAQAVDKLGISDQVNVVRARAEDHSETYDAVVSRALAPLDRLIGWCAPLRRGSGAILALKGSSAAQEVQTASRLLARHRLVAEVLVARALSRAEPTTVVRLTSA